MATIRRAGGAGGKGGMEEETAGAPNSRAEAPARHPPHLPTPLERAALALFPVMLAFGTVFSLVSPETRAAPYFARKSNVFNVVFVKRGWGWTTLAFVVFLVTHPSYGSNDNSSNTGWDLTPRRARAALRWTAVTGWWFLFTQWCLGPPVIDRGFRWTGGRCELARREVEMGDASDVGVGEMLTAVACKAAGGRWQGGHDISGHVFLLVLGTVFLMHEVGWPLLRWSSAWREERCVVMPDGAIKGAGVEAGDPNSNQGRSRPADGWEGRYALGAGGKIVLVVAGLNLWMLLMTAIYFHTWFEKLTGLLTALLGWYVVYVVPRFVPALRAWVGLPGI
ncbi:inositol phospholipid synthesis and fat-storage-inducing TM domain-containing protein [Hirsutella rhossiliensis]|uniref:Acyl-coenzyme A diphosphatase SCS3 n=1 Tax=Hirsutella rhossiliensis TaxID=111463 RepID=A0A9P8SKK8_9HYPO|nr:inositol phospholipid synthesis and fat-storage-inducing TM domain-containing protein [Hirsutella rhossiliensis]KAH0966001.1 inositol phospholipid synthesis and fat-storage-inducing TM domain-containing protein [Hirsutella rhossiliensis]